LGDRRSSKIQESPLQRVLLLAPSEGLGGGIERYVRGVESALLDTGITYERMNLRRAGEGHPSLRRKLAFSAQVRTALSADSRRTRIVAAHAGLLPVTFLARTAAAYDGTVVIYHGVEVWSTRRPPGHRVARHSDVRAIAVSSFTSGALKHAMPAMVVKPFLDRAWYSSLIAAGKSVEKGSPGSPVRVLTVFRLQDWESKGLPIIVNAIESLECAIELVVVGSGIPSRELVNFVRVRPWLQVKTALDDASLAAEYAAADVVILATRTRAGKHPSGEGFGLCLVEAQLAGTAVIAPAYGGSHDTFLQRITGLSPTDESSGALASVLRELATNPVMRAAMSRAGARWSRTAFEPTGGAKALVETLLSPIRE
jgi:phosphatidylinositol alpha-1,6-mannosyltransferase